MGPNFQSINLQRACALNDTESDYDASLTESVLSSLRYLKLESELTCGAILAKSSSGILMKVRRNYVIT